MDSREPKSCLYCKNIFMALSCEVKRGGGKCCSLSCASLYGQLVQANKKGIKHLESRSYLSGVARKVYFNRHNIQELPSCMKCGSKGTDIHHLNENRHDNAEINLAVLCRSCHTAYHNHVSPKRTRKDNESLVQNKITRLRQSS